MVAATGTHEAAGKHHPAPAAAADDEDEGWLSCIYDSMIYVAKRIGMLVELQQARRHRRNAPENTSTDPADGQAPASDAGVMSQVKPLSFNIAPHSDTGSSCQASPRASPRSSPRQRRLNAMMRLTMSYTGDDGSGDDASAGSEPLVAGGEPACS